MSTIRTMINSKALRLLVICIFPLCLAVPALDTAASPADLAAQVNDPLLPSISSIIDPPEIPFPKPPPSYQGTPAMEQTA